MGRGLLSLFFFALFSMSLSCAQKSKTPNQLPINPKGDRKGDQEEVKNWFTKDPTANGVEGTRADLTYKELHVRTGVEPIVVAVIDSGVDIDHEDLKDQIWINSAEMNGRSGVDDDNNGYVDDFHGWNFLGGYDDEGRPVNLGPTTLEVTREFARMKKLKKKRNFWGRKLSTEEAAYFEKLEKEVTSEQKDAQAAIDLFKPLLDSMRVQYEILQDLLKKDFNEVSLSDVEALETQTTEQGEAKDRFIQLFNSRNLSEVASSQMLVDYYGEKLKYYYNENFDPRAKIVKDDVNDFEDKGYGNNDVEALDADHGTHVAGIIAAVRNNGVGIDGIATDVRIMCLRAVPNGDEYDKDVANAVRYAVDNGAKIINMSFGKAYSPFKTRVDEAFQYAASKDVLIVHAAGNDSQNNNEGSNFPNRRLSGNASIQISGWIEVGASAAKKGLGLPADFSNYGDRAVDLFAPGVNINSTIPEKNQYASFSGTSMASPAAAGVAALVWSQYPELSAVKLKAVLESSVRTYPGLKVNLPSEEENPLEVLFHSLSMSGGVIDAYSALSMLAR